MTIVADAPTPVDTVEITLGIDTHADTHVAAVIDPLGRHLGQASFTPNASTANPRSRIFAASPRSPPHQARPPTGTVSIAAATETRTPRSTAS